MENMDCNRAVSSFFLEKQTFEGDSGIAEIHNIPAMFHKVFYLEQGCVW